MTEIFARSPIDQFAESLSDAERISIAIDYDELSRTGRVSETALLRLKTAEIMAERGATGPVNTLWLAQLGDAVHRVTSYRIMEDALRARAEMLGDMEP